MRPNELGHVYERHVRLAGGDPAAPTVRQGVDAFRSTLIEPFETGDRGVDAFEDVLLFEVGEAYSGSSDDPVGYLVNLDRRIFYGDVAEPEKLKVEWRYGLDPVLAEHQHTQIMGRGPGLAAGEGMTALEDFLAAVDASPVLARMHELTPVRVRVWIEARD